MGVEGRDKAPGWREPPPGGGGDTTECYHPRARLPVRVKLSLRSEVRTSPEGWTDGQTDRQSAVQVGCVNSREPAELKPLKQSGIVPVHNIRGLVTGQRDHSMAVLGTHLSMGSR